MTAPLPVVSAPKGFVHVVESPSPMDLLAAQTEGRLLGQALELAGIPHSYNLVTDRHTLEVAVGQRLGGDVTKFGLSPFLHFSMHGNEKGLALTSGEFLMWEDVRTLLMPLIQVMNGGLLICISACHGAHAAQMAMHEEDPAPAFWALVSNNGSPTWSDAAVAYVVFYHLFFKGRTLLESVSAMKVASGDNDFVAFSGRHLRDSWAASQRKYLLDEIAKSLLATSTPLAASTTPSTTTAIPGSSA